MAPLHLLHAASYNHPDWTTKYGDQATRWVWRLNFDTGMSIVTEEDREERVEHSDRFTGRSPSDSFRLLSTRMNWRFNLSPGLYLPKWIFTH